MTDDYLRMTAAELASSLGSYDYADRIFDVLIQIRDSVYEECGSPTREDDWPI
jgi:hypothetical protein